VLARSKQQRLRTLTVRQFPDQTRASWGSLESRMYVLGPLMIPAPSLAKIPTRRTLLRIADDGCTRI
jgi:hypothetical protein